MRDRMIVAIVRNERVPQVEQALLRAGAQGYSLDRVVGIGAWADYYQKDPKVPHARLVVFTEVEHTEALVQAVIEAAETGSVGDGIVAVLPVETVRMIDRESPKESDH